MVLSISSPLVWSLCSSEWGGVRVVDLYSSIYCYAKVTVINECSVLCSVPLQWH